jgi:hypothetical protein
MMTHEELLKTLDELRGLATETEWLEFKAVESKTFDFNELGKYFSMLSNEANLKDRSEAWLVFGVENAPPHRVVGTEFTRPGGWDGIKRDVAANADGHCFIEIYELKHPDGRVVMFQIPPAPEGKQVPWRGITRKKGTGEVLRDDETGKPKRTVKYWGRHGSHRSELAPYEEEHFQRQAVARDLRKLVASSDHGHESDCGDEFVGREWIINRVLLRDRGVLIIKGLPGKGKSALLAHLSRTLSQPDWPKPITFFFDRDRSADDCVRYLYASLLVDHDLVKPDSARDLFESENLLQRFRTALSDVSGRPVGGGCQVFLLDALDQARQVSDVPSIWDRLAIELPPHVFVIATTRKVHWLNELPPRVRKEIIDMEAQDNKNDDRRDGFDYAQRRLANLHPQKPLLDEVANWAAPLWQISLM